MALDLQSLYLGFMSRDVHSCTHWLRPRNPPPHPPAFGLVHEDAIGQQRQTISLCLQRWAGPQLVPLCAFPQLVQQGNLLRMCALIRRQLTAELRLRNKKYSCGPYLHYAQCRRQRERERINILSFSLCQIPEYRARRLFQDNIYAIEKITQHR